MSDKAGNLAGISLADVSIAVDEQVVTSSVELLQSVLGPQTSKHSVVDDTDAIAKDICFFHRMSCQKHGSPLFAFAVLQDVPYLSSSVRI